MPAVCPPCAQRMLNTCSSWGVRPSEELVGAGFKLLQVGREGATPTQLASVWKDRSATSSGVAPASLLAYGTARPATRRTTRTTRCKPTSSRPGACVVLQCTRDSVTCVAWCHSACVMVPRPDQQKKNPQPPRLPRGVAFSSGDPFAAPPRGWPRSRSTVA